MDRLARLNLVVCELARQASEKIMCFYRNGAAVTWKTDASPLTAADQASHDFLVNSLQSLMPEATVISEERRKQSTAPSKMGGYSGWWIRWMGPRSFLKVQTNLRSMLLSWRPDYRCWALSAHRHSILPIYGGRNFGSWRQVDGERPTPISTRRADSSELSLVASKDHAGPLVSAMLARLTHPQLQSMGSSLKFCLVAEGKADIYLRDLPTMEWDTAAAQCIVEAAGGGVYSLDGETLRYGKPGLKNPAIMTVGDTRLDWRRLIAQV